MNLISGLFLFTLFVYVNCDSVYLANGIINGTTKKSRNGRWFHQFYGIPYAKPPVNELRFKDPVPAESWRDIKPTSDSPPMCLQSKRVFGDASSILGQEDCLYLNVFVPNELLKPAGKSPVIVCIHGGGYSVGSSEWCSADFFMDYNVIFVSINYRLGILGFLGMNNDEISGNFGMKDQSMALLWVRENIARFGGDPANVTLVGGSAGAASIHLHMFSPLSKGLFQKAIMHSGNAFNTWSHFDDGLGEAVSTVVAVLSGCLRKDPTMMLKCLQRIPAKEFLALELQLHDLSAITSVLLRPMIESKVKKQPFLTRRPSKTNYQTLVPWITGINKGEGATVVIFNQPKRADKETILAGIAEFLYTTEPENIDTLVQNITHHYFGVEPEKLDFKNMTMKYIDLFTDAEFLHGFVKTVLSAGHQQYVFFYNHRGSFSIQYLANYTFDLGVCHADETPLLFRHEVWGSPLTPQDEKVSQTLLKFWTNFAISGDPNGQSGEKIWKPVETDDIEYLHIKSDSLVMEKKSLKERFDFWESLSLASKYT